MKISFAGILDCTNAYAMMLVAVLFSLLQSTAAYAGDSYRDGKWEISFIHKSQEAAVLSGPNGAKVDFSSDVGGGISVGFNAGDRLNFAFEFSSLEPSYKAEFIDGAGMARSIGRRSDFVTTQFNGTFHFLPGRFTPYVGAGLGWVSVDSNVKTGNSYCVPDYYWGWYCHEESYSDSDFSGNISAGLRADMTESVFLRASYNRQFSDFSAPSGNLQFDSVKLELGFMM
jgi:opacity protein-like surface antigen